MKVMWMLFVVGFLWGCTDPEPEREPPTEAELLEDAQIREFLRDDHMVAKAGEVWARRFCVRSEYNIRAGKVINVPELCRRDHLLYEQEVGYLRWLRDKNLRDEWKRSEAKKYEGEEEETK